MEGETNFRTLYKGIQRIERQGLLENKAAESAWRSGDSPEYLCAMEKMNPLPLSLLLPNEEDGWRRAAWVGSRGAKKRL